MFKIQNPNLGGNESVFAAGCSCMCNIDLGNRSDMIVRAYDKGNTCACSCIGERNKIANRDAAKTA